MELWEEDLYELLNCAETATPEEIKKAYKKLAIELHPDRFPDDAAKREDATHRFGKITNAYNILKDEEERAEYDFARRLGFSNASAGPSGGGAKAGGAPAGTAGAAAAPGARSAAADDDPGVSDARKNQAEQQFALGKIAHKGKGWAKAIQHYKEAARLDPTVADYPAHLGLAYLQQNLATPAQKAFEQAYKLDKKNSILKEHYSPPDDKGGKKGGKSGGGGLFAFFGSLFGGGKKDAKGKKDDKKKDAKGKKAAGKKAAGKR